MQRIVPEIYASVSEGHLALPLLSAILGGGGALDPPVLSTTRVDYRMSYVLLS